MSPPDGPLSPIEVRIAHVEITQGLQLHDNSLPLVIGRPTVVRVLPAFAGPEAKDAKVLAGARLRARRDGATGWDKWIDPDNGYIQVVRRPWRGAAEQSLNFTLEPHWYSNPAGFMADHFETEFEIELVVQAPTQAVAGGNGSRKLRAVFQRRRGLKVHYVRVKFKGDTPRDRVATQDALGLIRSYFPADPTEVIYSPDPTGTLICNAEEDGRVDGTALILKLNAVFLGSPDADWLYGWTPEKSFASNGRSDPRYLHGLGRVALGNDTGDPKERLKWRWRRTFAHELGHNLDDHGLIHPPRNPLADTWFPSRLQDDQFGFDVLGADPKQPSRQVMRCLDEHLLFDFMVGGKRECQAWIGRRHYVRLFDWLEVEKGQLYAAAQPAQPAGTRRRLVSGTIHVDGWGRLQPLFRYPLTPKTTRAAKLTPFGLGRAEVRFFRQDGREISSLRIGWTPSFKDSEGQPLPSSPFCWMVALTPDQEEQVARVELSYDGQRLAWTPEPVALNITDLHVEPSGQFGQTVDVSWEVGLDSDAPEESVQQLEHQIYYSPDSEHWRLVATGIAGTAPSVHVGTRGLPRGADDRGFMRVQSCIGVEVHEATTDFALEPGEPRLSIVAPQDQQHYAHAAPILLMGYAHQGDDRIPGGQLRWSREINGNRQALGQGEKCVVRGPALPPGQHRIHLTVGEQDESVTIFVGAVTTADTAQRDD